MPYNLTLLTYTPDLRHVDPLRARVVNALRYGYVAKEGGKYCPQIMANILGSGEAISSFHVFLDEAGHAWPEPISLNRPCDPALSYDETLLADLCTAAARNERSAFDRMTEDMLGQGARNSIWASARRLIRHFGAVIG